MAMRRWLPFLLLTLLAPGLWASIGDMEPVPCGYDSRNGSADPAGYVDGYSLYNGYFVPNAVDPEGKFIPLLLGAYLISGFINAAVDFETSYFTATVEGRSVNSGEYGSAFFAGTLGFFGYFSSSFRLAQLEGKVLKAQGDLFVEAEKLSGKGIKFLFNKRSQQFVELSTGRAWSSREFYSTYASNNGFVKEEAVVLKSGQRFDRFGATNRKFVGTPGSTPSQRGQPEGANSGKYTVWEVVSDIPAKGGPAAAVPEIGAAGGSMQYLLEETLDDLASCGKIRLITQTILP